MCTPEAEDLQEAAQHEATRLALPAGASVPFLDMYATAPVCKVLLGTAQYAWLQHVHLPEQVVRPRQAGGAAQQDHTWRSAGSCNSRLCTAQHMGTQHNSRVRGDSRCGPSDVRHE